MRKKKSNFRKGLIKLMRNNPNTFIVVILWTIISIIFIYKNKWEIPIILLLVGIILGCIYGGIFHISYFFKNKK
jgi:hypothetical protein